MGIGRHAEAMLQVLSEEIKSLKSTLEGDGACLLH